MDAVKAKLAEFDASLQVSSNNYADYLAKLQTEAQAKGMNINAAGALVQTQYGKGGETGKREMVIESGFAMSESEWNEKRIAQSKELAGLAAGERRAYSEIATEAGKAANSVGDLADSTAQSAEQAKKAAEEIKKARQEVAKNAVGTYELAVKLKYATSKDMLGQVEEMLKNQMTSRGENTGKITETLNAIGLQTGEVTQKGLILANQVAPKLASMFDSGLLPIDKYKTIVEKITGIVQAGGDWSKEINKWKNPLDGPKISRFSPSEGFEKNGPAAVNEGLGGTAENMGAVNTNTSAATQAVETFTAQSLPALESKLPIASTAVQAFNLQIGIAGEKLRYVIEKTGDWKKALQELWLYITTHSFEANMTVNGSGGGVAGKVGTTNINTREFAKGGTALAGQPAIVGEEGWELVVPEKDMRVFPHGKTGIGNINNVYRFYGTSNINLNSNQENGILDAAGITL